MDRLARNARPEDLAAREAAVKPYGKTVVDVVRGGGKVLAGTDSPIFPYALAFHTELELFVESGLTPFEALQTATTNAAEALGEGAESGVDRVGQAGRSRRGERRSAGRRQECPKSAAGDRERRGLSPRGSAQAGPVQIDATVANAPPLCTDRAASGTLCPAPVRRRPTQWPAAPAASGCAPASRRRHWPRAPTSTTDREAASARRRGGSRSLRPASSSKMSPSIRASASSSDRSRASAFLTSGCLESSLPWPSPPTRREAP